MNEATLVANKALFILHKNFEDEYLAITISKSENIGHYRDNNNDTKAVSHLLRYSERYNIVRVMG